MPCCDSLLTIDILSQWKYCWACDKKEGHKPEPKYVCWVAVSWTLPPYFRGHPQISPCISLTTSFC